MKVYIFISSVILTINCVFVHGDLQTGLGIRKFTNKVKENVHSLLHLKTNERIVNEGSIVFRDSDEDFQAPTTAKAPLVTPGVFVQRGGDIGTTTPTVIETTTAEKTNTTEKDGRENFAGGCATGFMRTADGRCKPTF